MSKDLDTMVREGQRAGWLGLLAFLLLLGMVIATSDRCQGPATPVPSPSATATK